MRTYSVDLRERVCQARDAGMPRTEVARLFRVSESSVARWHRDWAAGHALAPKRRPGRTPKIGRADHPALAAQVAADPDATLAMHCASWEAAHGVAVSEATMCRALRKAGLTLKKRRPWRASATRTPARLGATRPRPSSRAQTSSSSTRPAPR